MRALRSDRWRYTTEASPTTQSSAQPLGRRAGSEFPIDAEEFRIGVTQPANQLLEIGDIRKADTSCRPWGASIAIPVHMDLDGSALHRQWLNEVQSDFSGAESLAPNPSIIHILPGRPFNIVERPPSLRKRFHRPSLA